MNIMKENFLKVKFSKIFFYLSVYFLIIFSFYSEYQGLAECKVSFSITYSNPEVYPNSYAFEINGLLDSKLKNHLRYHKKRVLIDSHKGESVINFIIQTQVRAQGDEINKIQAIHDSVVQEFISNHARFYKLTNIKEASCIVATKNYEIFTAIIMITALFIFFLMYFAKNIKPKFRR
jgi:hypothetical protein